MRFRRRDRRILWLTAVALDDRRKKIRERLSRFQRPRRIVPETQERQGPTVKLRLAIPRQTEHPANHEIGKTGGEVLNQVKLVSLGK